MEKVVDEEKDDFAHKYLKAKFRESLAEYAHTAWSGWMKYMFSIMEEDDSGTMIMPAWAVERWKRQSSMPYADLPEEEKESDRKEADAMLAIFEGI